MRPIIMYLHPLRYAFGVLAMIGSAVASGTTEITAAVTQPRPEIGVFIGEMVERHGFEQGELESVFGMARFQPAIIKAISQPATSKPWDEYRPLFINPRRIAGGVAF